MTRSHTSVFFEEPNPSVSGHHGRTGAAPDLQSTLVGSSDEYLDLMRGMITSFMTLRRDVDLSLIRYRSQTSDILLYSRSAPPTLIPCERIPDSTPYSTSSFSQENIKNTTVQNQKNRVVFTTRDQFPLLRKHAERTHLRVTSWTSAVSGHADMSLINPRYSSELPSSVACKSRTAPVRPWCPETLGLGSSKKADVCTRTAKMGVQVKHGHSQKGFFLIVMVFIHPCMKSGTFSLRNRASGTAKVFS